MWDMHLPKQQIPQGDTSRHCTTKAITAEGPGAARWEEHGGWKAPALCAGPYFPRRTIRGPPFRAGAPPLGHPPRFRSGMWWNIKGCPKGGAPLVVSSKCLSVALCSYQICRLALGSSELSGAAQGVPGSAQGASGSAQGGSGSAQGASGSAQGGYKLFAA